MKYNFEVKLPKKFKAKWLKALRSGKYKQSRNGNLVDDKGFCCLGVAGAVCGIPVENMSWHSFLNQYLKGINKVPKTVLKVFKQQIDEDSSWPVDHHLAFMNDGKKSFKQIARWIEKHL